MACIFVFIGITSELFRQIGFYIEQKADFCFALMHLLSSMPWWLVQALPIVSLLSLLFSVGDLSKKNEIIAMKASGINTWRIIVLLITLGLIVGLFDFFIREFIAPKTNLYSEVIKKEVIKKEVIKKEVKNLVVLLQDSKMLTIGHLNIERKMMKDIVIEKYNSELAIKYLILAKIGIWHNGTWILKNGVIRHFNANLWKELYFRNYNSKIYIKPEDMLIQKIRYNTMNTCAFKKYINNLKNFRQSGIEERSALIVLNIRYATIFTHIVVMMIGVPFALGTGSRLNKTLNSILALFSAFMYWGTQTVAKSLGENFILSPFIAAWIPNFVFMIIGIYFLTRIRK
jgi:lipopolysaccharide export system permease protein